MKAGVLGTKRTQQWDCGDAIDAIGEADFAVRFLAALNQLAHIDHAGLFEFDEQLHPSYVAGHSGTRHGVTDAANAAYQAGEYFRYDPNLALVGNKPDGDGPLLNRQRIDDIADESYRKEIYERYDLAERVSLIDQRDGRWFTINLYRDTPMGLFPDDEVSALQHQAASIAAIAAKHLQMVSPAKWSSATRPPVNYLEDQIARLTGTDGARLSAREIEVCARAVLGVSGEGIALDLGVKQSTVATLRKRAYAKLGISTVHELFALCLGQQR